MLKRYPAPPAKGDSSTHFKNSRYIIKICISTEIITIKIKIWKATNGLGDPIQLSKAIK